MRNSRRRCAMVPFAVKACRALRPYPEGLDLTQVFRFFDGV